jgi:hypothetical protein
MIAHINTDTHTDTHTHVCTRTHASVLHTYPKVFGCGEGRKRMCPVATPADQERMFAISPVAHVYRVKVRPSLNAAWMTHE